MVTTTRKARTGAAIRTDRNSCAAAAFAAKTEATTASRPRATAASHSQVRWVIVSGSPTAGGLAGYLKNGTASIANQPNVASVRPSNGPDSIVTRRA